MSKIETHRVVRGEVWYDCKRWTRIVEWWSSHYSNYSVRAVGFRLVEEIDEKD
jgi:formylglycine-generating enzyme required for sulfatase activity